MIHIQLDTKNIKQLGFKLRQLSQLQTDNRLLSQIGKHLAAQGKRNINESSPDGTTSYKLLKPSTIKSKLHKRSNRNPHKPLIASGLMRQSIDAEVSGSKLYLTTLDYARHHQYGAPKNNMPARPIFSIRPHNLKTISSFIIQALKKTIK